MTQLTMPNLKASLLRSFENGLQRSILESRERYSAKSYNMSVRNARPGVVGEADDAQKALRPLFGKGPVQRPTIGDHPDFLHLKGTDDVCYCPITTMFMDIESSTRLSLLFPLEEVRSIKNAFIQTAIQIVRCFDGHVHRIMGDAVMAYFGGRMVSAEDSSINGLNCAATLQVFAEKVVGPKLASMGFDHDFGIRIGLDHGPEEKVLWSAYGYPGVEEVTATSFHVDVAAKLQHAAGRNRSMLGGTLVETLDFPSKLTSIKSVRRGGQSVQVPFVQPNHTDREGIAIDYRQWKLSTFEYLKCTPLGNLPILKTDTLTMGLNVRAEVYDEHRQNFEGLYHAASRILPKKRCLKFLVSLPYMPQLPYTIRFIADNHGREAWTKNPVGGDSHKTDYEIRTQSQHDKLSHWEQTSFRGLHYMTVEVRTGHGTQFRTRFGVFVE